MSSRVVVGIVALTVVISAIAAVAAYFFDSVTPALALGAVAAVLAVLSFIVAGIALGRQQGVVSEQTSLAVMLDKSLVRMGRRIDEQEVKFAAARAVGAHRRPAQPATDQDEAAAPMPRAETQSIEKPAPRTAIEVAETKPEPEARERHKAKFLPAADMTTVEYDRAEEETTVEFGRSFEIMLEPIVAIPSGNVAAYRVLAGFQQTDGSHAAVSETPPGNWGGSGAAFGEALVAGTAATAEQHFDVAGDAQLYMPVTAALMEDEQAIRALARRFGDDPPLARTVIPILRASLLEKGGETIAERVALLTGAGASLALQVDNPDADIAALAERIGARAVFAEVELFPSGGQPDWSEAVMEGTEALVVATGVRTEGSVIAMMDLNVGYMCGPLFAEPKRLKAAGPVPADAH